MLPTPVDLRDDLTLQEALRRLSTACLRTISHQDTPPHWLRVEMAELQASSGPYANHSFILQNYPLPSLALQGVEARTLNADYGLGAKLEIDLLMVPGFTGWTGVFEFSAERYRRAQLQTLLVEMVEIASRFHHLAHFSVKAISEHLNDNDSAAAGRYILDPGVTEDGV
jgi:hypothetical protein